MEIAENEHAETMHVLDARAGQHEGMVKAEHAQMMGSERAVGELDALRGLVESKVVDAREVMGVQAAPKMVDEREEWELSNTKIPVEVVELVDETICRTERRNNLR